ncbi:MAG: hypothetical protein DRJ42_24530 [Deltaproteobacteria bacterium]|nr:MAG: hypothetical protein DRJ42_24530 [Deltaproteobacteria bacterium]
MASSASNAPLRHAATLREGEKIRLDARHVQGLGARGIKVKEAFTIVDGAGDFFRASLSEMNKRGGAALVYEKMLGSTESPARITLLCAVLARQRMMGVVQKATELGVMRIVPVLSERSIQREGLDHEKAGAWPKQALRAARQCRRASLPEVREAIELEAILEDPCFTGADLCVYLDDRTTRRNALAGAVAGPDRPESEVVFAVGPEGGWTDEERGLLEDRGAAPLRLGGRVLRAETAVWVGLTLLQHAYGDM